MRILRGLIICEDPELRARVQELLLETGQVEPTLVLQRYPERAEAARHLNLCRPDVVLMAIDRLQAVMDLLQELEASGRGVPIVGISRLQDPRALAELMRLGIRDCVAAPLNRIKFHEAIHRVVYQFKEALQQLPPEPLACFLPSRGGSGTSTLACNISYAMSVLPGAEVLLADLDLPAGLSRFLFKLTPSSSLGELMESGRSLDERNWRQWVAPAGKLHVIHGGRVNPRVPFTSRQMRQLLEFVISRYTAICADLTGGMETYAMELMRRSRRILLVSTTEAPSIALAREKLEFLRTMDLLPRTGVVLTLWPGAATPKLEELQEYLGAPIAGVFDFGEKKVRQCLSEGLLIDRRTTLGRQIGEFTRALKADLANGIAKAG
jgi:pilus assembly protein CpaE